jgi:hypothetical protein
MQRTQPRLICPVTIFCGAIQNLDAIQAYFLILHYQDSQIGLKSHEQQGKVYVSLEEVLPAPLGSFTHESGLLRFCHHLSYLLKTVDFSTKSL